MPLAIPPELKKIAPFVKRAEELDKDKTSPQSRLVAYYCRQYAVHVGIPLAGNVPAAKTCLGHLLSDLEKEKPTMDNFTRDEAAYLCRQFAEGVFNKADAEDRSGNAGKATAKTFYAAASFLQILEQFAGDNDENVEEDKKRIVYAKWKSTEILKALKEGRQPTPGGYGEEEEEEEEEENDDEKSETKETPAALDTVQEDDGDDEEMDTREQDDFGLPPAPSTALKPPSPMKQPAVPPPQSESDNMDADDDDKEEEEEEEEEVGTEVELGPPPAYPASGDDEDDQPMSDPSPSSRVDRPTISFELPTAPDPIPPPVAAPKKNNTGMFGFGKKKKTATTKADMKDAMELARFAIAALEDKDADLAADRLKQALSALGR